MLTVDRSRASIRSIGRGRRTIEVTYHQNGTARRMSNGKAKVVTRRRFVEGLIAAVISAGVRRSPAGRIAALVPDGSGPLILRGCGGLVRSSDKQEVSHAQLFLTFLTRSGRLGCGSWAVLS